MTDWDNLSGDELNRKIAELRGWRVENWNVYDGSLLPVWHDECGSHIEELPDIAGDNCAALEFAEWMKGRGYDVVIYLFSSQDDYGTDITLLNGDIVEITNQPTLSLAIAQAGGMALESEKK